MKLKKTLKRNMTGKANATAKSHMLTALWTRETEAGCKHSISKAIETAKDEATKAYIGNNWEVDMHMWAYFARRKACLLQQVSFSLNTTIHDNLTNVSVSQL